MRSLHIKYTNCTSLKCSYRLVYYTVNLKGNVLLYMILGKLNVFVFNANLQNCESQGMTMLVPIYETYMLPDITVISIANAIQLHVH